MMKSLFLLAGLTASASAAAVVKHATLTAGTTAHKVTDAEFVFTGTNFDTTTCTNNHIHWFYTSDAAGATYVAGSLPSGAAKAGCTATSLTYVFSSASPTGHADMFDKYLNAAVETNGYLSPIVVVSAKVAAGDATTVLPTVTAGTTALLVGAKTMTITGTNFAPICGWNSVAITAGAGTAPSGTVTGCTGTTQLVVTFTGSGLNRDLVADTIISTKVTSKSAVAAGATVDRVQTTATASHKMGALPGAATITASTTNWVVGSSDTLTIAGTNFDDQACTNNAVTFTPAGGAETFTITSCTTTQLVATFTAMSWTAGLVTGTVNVKGQGDITAVNVATVVAATAVPTITAGTQKLAVGSTSLTVMGTNFALPSALTVFGISASANAPTIASTTCSSSTTCVLTLTGVVAGTADVKLDVTAASVQMATFATKIVAANAATVADFTLTAGTTALTTGTSTFALVTAGVVAADATCALTIDTWKPKITTVHPTQFSITPKSTCSCTSATACSASLDASLDTFAVGSIVSLAITQYGVTKSAATTIALTAGAAPTVTATASTAIAADATTVTITGTGFPTACSSTMVTFTGAGAPMGAVSACTATALTVTLDAAPTGNGALSAVVKVPYAAATTAAVVGTVATMSPTMAPTTTPVVFSAAPTTGASVFFVSLLSAAVALFY